MTVFTFWNWLVHFDVSFHFLHMSSRPIFKRYLGGFCHIANMADSTTFLTVFIANVSETTYYGESIPAALN